VLAHQGGWDEILLVLGPILVIAGLLRLAKQRVDREPPDGDQDRDPQGHDPRDPHDPHGHDPRDQG
jgi:hypothetical protein